MIPTPFLKRVALLVCMAMIASCAVSPRISTVAPPRLALPDATLRPCSLATLPAEPTVGDLEAGYMLRGAQVVACDGARRLAVETLIAERAMREAQAVDQRRGVRRRFGI